MQRRPRTGTLGSLRPTICSNFLQFLLYMLFQRCTKSLSWANEVVVVDDFSTDGTPDVCRKFPNVNVCQNVFKGFQEQKIYAMNLAKNDWVLKIDADERVSFDMRKSIEGLTTTDFELYSCFEFRRLTCFWDKWIRYASFYPDYNPRLFHRRKGEWGGINPHDKFMPTGRTKRLKGDILHFQNWNLETYASRTVLYSQISANEYFKRGRKVSWHHVTLRPLYTFFYRFVIRLGFIAGWRGFVISVMGAMGTFIKYMKLYELHKGHGRLQCTDDVK